jgi:hypothetical protein
MLKHLSITLLLFVNSTVLLSQECIGGQIYSNEAFLYGRFEVAMRSVGELGVVSSFFLYNLDVGCNWPEENNEIDIEMTGNSETILFTTHYPGPWYYTDSYVPDFNPHDSIHSYAIEWEPGIVRWFVDSQLVVTQDQSFVDGLIYPLRIVMNLWAADNIAWVGEWDPAVMPVESEYEYVRFYEYAPDSGDAGTNNNFSLVWDDEFESYVEERWTIEDFGGFGGNFCDFKSSSVEFNNDRLYLKLEEQELDTVGIPVTFSVNVSEQDFLPSDVIYLNGSFNDWCGTCLIMVGDNDVWTKTINLLPGEYEFLFTKNYWEENGGAPIGSECDYKPCDEWANYGFLVSEDSDPIFLPTYCWGSCVNCSSVDILENDWLQDFYISPNPNNGVFSLKASLAAFGDIVISISDLQGKVIYQTTETNKELNQNINLSNTENGIYILNISSQYGSISEKIFISK